MAHTRSVKYRRVPGELTRHPKAQVFEQLRPGDLILTYTAGYISDVFIPGAFKHGITFVGSPEQRVQAGLTIPFPAVAPDARDQLEAHVALPVVNGSRKDAVPDRDILLSGGGLRLPF